MSRSRDKVIIFESRAPPRVGFLARGGCHQSGATQRNKFSKDMQLMGIRTVELELTGGKGAEAPSACQRGSHTMWHSRS